MHSFLAELSRSSRRSWKHKVPKIVASCHFLPLARGFVELHLDKIAKHYLRTWFAPDVCMFLAEKPDRSLKTYFFSDFWAGRS